MPNFVKFKPEFHSFEIESTEIDAVGIYKIGLSMGYKEFPLSATICTKTISISYDANFKGEEIEDQIILATGSSWSMVLPQYTDSFGQNAKFELNLGTAISFLAYDPETNSIKTVID